MYVRAGTEAHKRLIERVRSFDAVPVVELTIGTPVLVAVTKERTRASVARQLRGDGCTSTTGKLCKMT